MAAATVNAAEYLTNLEGRWIPSAARELTEYSRPYVYNIPFCQTFTIPTTSTDDANDFTRLIKCPGGGFIWDWRDSPSDMDSGTALVYDILVAEESAAGSGSWTTRVTLVSGSTAGQAGTASNRIANAAVGKRIGVNDNYWIVMKTTTAATTPVAGTLKCAWVMSLGVVNRGKQGAFFGDPEV